MNASAMLIAVRFALYLDLMLAFGLPLFLLYVPRGVEQRAGYQPVSSSVIIALSLVGAGLSVVGLLLLAATMSDVPLFQVDRETINALVNGTAVGTAGEIRVAALLAMLPITAFLRSRGRKLYAALSYLSAVALGSLAWTGHGAADEGSKGIIHLTADIGHLLAAGAWIGALATLLILLLRARRKAEDQRARIATAHDALARFASVGTVCVALIILTGIANSWVLIGPDNVKSLAGSLYGRLLIIKLVLFVGMLGLAGLNRFRLTPAIGDSLTDGSSTLFAIKAITRNVIIESGLALMVLGLVAWLGTLEPPVAG